MPGFRNGLSSIIIRLRIQFSALPVGRCSRKRRIRPLLKQTLLCKFIIISTSRLLSLLQFAFFLKDMVMEYMVFGCHRFLKVAVIGGGS